MFIPADQTSECLQDLKLCEETIMALTRSLTGELLYPLLHIREVLRSHINNLLVFFYVMPSLLKHLTTAGFRNNRPNSVIKADSESSPLRSAPTCSRFRC